jgi:hypothetical protein
LAALNTPIKSLISTILNEEVPNEDVIVALDKDLGDENILDNVCCELLHRL